MTHPTNRPVAISLRLYRSFLAVLDGLDRKPFPARLCRSISSPWLTGGSSRLLVSRTTRRAAR